MDKKAIFGFIFLLVIGLSFFCGFNALAQSDPTMDGLNATAGRIDAFKDKTTAIEPTTFLQTEAGRVVGVILSFVGILFLGLMIYAGLMWMTAEGNEQQITKAKSLLINAIIGIIIVFAAYAITSFIGTDLLLAEPTK